MTNGGFVEPDRVPYGLIATSLKDGTLIPFFGAAASAINRPPNATWGPGKPFLPFGSELATYLADAANYPAIEEAFNALFVEMKGAMNEIGAGAGVPSPVLDKIMEAIVPVVRKHVGKPNLALIASWVEHVQGTRRVVDKELRKAFAVSVPPGEIQKELAAIDGTKLFLTTNYDDLLEQALAPRHPHVIVDRGEKGLWVRVGGGPPRLVARTGTELPRLLDKAEERSAPIIFKMHGSIDADVRNDSYLITEEDYVDFLAREKTYVHPHIQTLMEGKNLLFLGYSLEDWNVRVILRKLIRSLKPADVRFYAIVRGPSRIEEEVWRSRDLNIYAMDLGTFMTKLKKYL